MIDETFFGDWSWNWQFGVPEKVLDHLIDSSCDSKVDKELAVHVGHSLDGFVPKLGRSV